MKKFQTKPKIRTNNEYFIQTSRQKCLQWIVHHPKKFFAYSMIFLSVSFIGSLIQGIFFPSETVFTIKPPVLYSKSQKEQNPTVNNEKRWKRLWKSLKF
jgi:hypothetical protein